MTNYRQSLCQRRTTKSYLSSEKNTFISEVYEEYNKWLVQYPQFPCPWINCLPNHFMTFPLPSAPNSSSQWLLLPSCHWQGSTLMEQRKDGHQSALFNIPPPNFCHGSVFAAWWSICSLFEDWYVIMQLLFVWVKRSASTPRRLELPYNSASWVAKRKCTYRTPGKKGFAKMSE